MAERWFVLQAGKSVGPLPFERLQQLASSGRLKPEDSIRLEESEIWQKAKQNPKIQFAVQITSDAHPSTPSASRLSSSVPKGRAVANAPQPRATVAAAIPKGRVVSSPSSEAPAFISAASPPKPMRQTAQPATNRGPIYLMIGGIVVCLLGSVAILVATGAIPSSSGPAVAEAKPKSPARAQASPPSANVDAEAEAAAALEEIAPEPAKPKPNAKAEKSQVTAKAVKRPILQIKRWSDVSKGASLTLGSVTVKVANSWLAKDEAGTPIAADSDEAKFLVVELDVGVKAGAAPLTYSGWQDAAILLDAKGNELSRVAGSARPSEKQSKGQRLRPGEKSHETLIFAINSAELESFRLALPVTQVGIKDDRHFAFEIPKHALGRAEPEAATGPSIAARRTASDDGPGEIMEKTPSATSLAADPQKMDPKKREDLEFEKERERLRKSLQMDEEPTKVKVAK